jgi:hypothetical protein
LLLNVKREGEYKEKWEGASPKIGPTRVPKQAMAFKVYGKIDIGRDCENHK